MLSFETVLLAAMLVLLLTLGILQLIAIIRPNRQMEAALRQQMREMLNDIIQDIGEMRTEHEGRLERLRESLTQRFDTIRDAQHKGLSALSHDIFNANGFLFSRHFAQFIRAISDACFANLRNSSLWLLVYSVSRFILRPLKNFYKILYATSRTKLSCL